MKPITAVVVTYQSEKTLVRAFESLQRCHASGLADVVFVDNDSKDETAKLLNEQCDWSRVILTGRNAGFGAGCNVGAELSDSAYTIFINPDAMVEPEALRALLDFMESHPQVGICGPAIVEGDGILQVTSELPVPRDIILCQLPIGVNRSSVHEIRVGDKPERTGWVCGAVLMIRTHLMRKLGGFDPRFFLYWEETDLCRRAADAGYETWAVGTVSAYHVGGASSEPDSSRVSGCIAVHYYQSRFYYFCKHHGYLMAATFEFLEYGVLVLKTLVDFFRGRGVSRILPRSKAPIFSFPKPV